MFSDFELITKRCIIVSNYTIKYKKAGNIMAVEIRFSSLRSLDKIMGMGVFN